MDFLSYKKSILHIENVNLEELASTIPTPFYVYSHKKIADQYNKLRTAMGNKNALICYAVKACPNINIIKLLSEQGSGADCVSQGEIIRALTAKVPPNKIVFSGIGKTKDEIIFALQNHILQFNVESIPELFLINETAKELHMIAPIAIRINPNIDAKTHYKITTGTTANKFGIDVNDLDKVFESLSTCQNLDFIGFSIHIGSQITDLSVFKKAFEALANLCAFATSKGYNLKRLDLGGGIGISYQNEKTIDINSYASLVKEIFSDFKGEIIIEPGRFLVGEAGLLISSVLYVKKTKEKNFLIIDAAMNDLIRHSLYDAYHKIITVEEKQNNEGFYDVVGPVCESSDVFAYDRPLPSFINPGDLLAICTTGAYGASMSSTYNSRPLIAEILVNDKDSKIIREKWDISQAIALETK